MALWIGCLNSCSLDIMFVIVWHFWVQWIELFIIRAKDEWHWVGSFSHWHLSHPYVRILLSLSLHAAIKLESSRKYHCTVFFSFFFLKIFYLFNFSIIFGCIFYHLIFKFNILNISRWSLSWPAGFLFFIEGSQSTSLVNVNVNCCCKCKLLLF